MIQNKLGMNPVRKLSRVYEETISLANTSVFVLSFYTTSLREFQKLPSSRFYRIFGVDKPPAALTFSLKHIYSRMRFIRLCNIRLQKQEEYNP